jgi:lactoylglutathione lyase
MIRVHDLDATLRFFKDGLGLRETRRMDNPQGKYTLVFLAADETPEAEIELTYNWDSTEDYGARATSGTSPSA